MFMEVGMIPKDAHKSDWWHISGECGLLTLEAVSLA